MKTNIKTLCGVTIDRVEPDAIFPHYAVIWGRKYFWQKSKPILQICTCSGNCSDVYDGAGNSFDYHDVVAR